MSKCFCFFHLCRRIHRVHKQCFIWNYIKAAVTKANKNTKRKKRIINHGTFQQKPPGISMHAGCAACNLISLHWNCLFALLILPCNLFGLCVRQCIGKGVCFCNAAWVFFSSDLDTFRLRLQHYVISWSSACCIHMYICFPALIIRTICFSFHACECGFD